MRAEKQYLIDEVSGHLKKSDYVILTNFTKLTVADAAELRKRLAPEKAEFHVVKNSSFRVAAKAMGLPDLDKSLAGQTAVVVGGKNPAGVAKALKKFIEEKDSFMCERYFSGLRIGASSNKRHVADGMMRRTEWPDGH